MIPATIQESETALRRAVERRQFSRVEDLLASHCGLTNEHLATLAPGEPARAELLTRVMAVLKWTRLMLYLAKAGFWDQLDRLLLAKRYSVPHATGSPNVHLDC